MAREALQRNHGLRAFALVRLLLFGMLLSLGACSSVGSYFGDRGLDFIDIVDLEYGIGLGVVAAAGSSLGANAPCG